jgi:uncharacterized protein (TIGR02271 family)
VALIVQEGFDSSRRTRLLFFHLVSHARFAGILNFQRKALHQTFAHQTWARQKSHYAKNTGEQYMSSTQTSRNESLNTSSQRVVAFFRDKDDAYRAISQLQAEGFTSSDLGVIEGRSRDVTAGSQADHDDQSRDNNSIWEKIKGFFTGESHDESGYDYDESVGGMDWERSRANYYYQGINAGGALVTVSGTRANEARPILQASGGDLRNSGFENFSENRETGSNIRSTSTGGSIEGERRIQLRGEVLRTYKERVQRGEVRLRKEVVTENQNIEVPVTREELVIERVPASGQAQAAEIGTDEEIRVPLSEERVRAEKQAVVNEEVRVGKRGVQNTEHVSDSLRHEELRVDKSGDVNVDSDVSKTGKRKKPAA